jgi:hypothetical protein
MPSVAVRVHRWVSTNRFRRPGSRCPAVRCPAVRCPDIWLPCLRSLCLAVWCPARLVSSLSGVQPSGVRPPVASVRPAQPGVALGDTSVRRGNLHAWDESSSMWSGVCPPERFGRRPESAWIRATLRRSCGGQRGGVGRGPGRVVLGRGGCGRPTRRPDRRKGAPSLATAPGRVLAEVRRSRTRRVAAILAGARPRSVVVVEPDARVDGLGRANERDGEDGRAAPARPRCAGGAPGTALAAL